MTLNRFLWPLARFLRRLVGLRAYEAPEPEIAAIPRETEEPIGFRKPVPWEWCDKCYSAKRNYRRRYWEQIYRGVWALGCEGCDEGEG